MDKLFFPWNVGDVLEIEKLGSWANDLSDNDPTINIPESVYITITKIGEPQYNYFRNYIPFAAKTYGKEYGFSYSVKNKYNLIKSNKMEQKQLKINVPEGYEIDKENSTFENIAFKPIKEVLIYEDVAIDLFYGVSGYYISTDGTIIRNDFTGTVSEPNNCVTERQAEKLLAINKLMNVAKYLNGDWKLDLSTSGKDKNKRYFIYSTLYNDGLDTHSEDDCCSKGHAYFKTEELAQKAIEILGEDVIKLALCVDY